MSKVNFLQTNAGQQIVHEASLELLLWWFTGYSSFMVVGEGNMHIAPSPHPAFVRPLPTWAFRKERPTTPLVVEGILLL